MTFRMTAVFTALLLVTLGQTTRLMASGSSPHIHSTTKEENSNSSTNERPKIQLAILLDTSLSMKGLVNQAQFQVWNVITELSKATRDGQMVSLEIAVYDYGNIWNEKSAGYVGQRVAFTDDLDEVSRALFSVRVDRGRCGEEYCGTAIAKSIEELDWDDSPSTYRTIVIAGNEPFNQGPIKFGSSLPTLSELQLPLNTIYCLDQNYRESLVGADQWRLASELSGGRYAKINHNHHLPDVETPYDAELRVLNERMNETFMWYGKDGERAMRNQIEQDQNAEQLSDHAFAARMSAKIGHLYQHVHDDLVDAHQHDQLNLQSAKRSRMPEEIKDLSDEEMLERIDAMAGRREQIRREMADTLAKRNLFLHRKMSETIGEEEESPMWGDALIEALQQQAIDRGFRFDEAVAEAN